MLHARQGFAVLLTILALALVACGGGGGGGGGSNPPPPPPAGDFTLSTRTVSFAAKLGKPNPPVQAVTMTLLDTQPAAVGAGYVAPQTAPAWLLVNITGNAPTFHVELSVFSGALPIGHQSAVLTVGTGDSAGNVLQTKTITINVDVAEPIVASTAGLSSNFVLGDPASSSTTPIAVTADAASRWNVLTNMPWIHVESGITFTGSQLTSVTIDASTLDAGTYNGVVSILNPDDP